MAGAHPAAPSPPPDPAPAQRPPNPPRGGSSSSWRAPWWWRLCRRAGANPRRAPPSCAGRAAPASCCRRASGSRPPSTLRRGQLAVASRPCRCSIRCPRACRRPPARPGRRRRAAHLVSRQPCAIAHRVRPSADARRSARRVAPRAASQGAQRRPRRPAATGRALRPLAGGAQRQSPRRPDAPAASGRCVPACRPASAPSGGAGTRSTRSCTISTRSPSRCWTIPTRRDLCPAAAIRIPPVACPAANPSARRHGPHPEGSQNGQDRWLAPNAEGEPRRTHLPPRLALHAAAICG